MSASERVHLLTFGHDESWRHARERTGAAAVACGFRPLVCDATHLGLWPHLEWAQSPAGARGFGYWGWKPYLVGKLLESLPDGDLVVYSDAGNVLTHGPGWDRYLDMARDTGGCFFFHDVRHATDAQYTKADLLAHFDPDNHPGLGMLWAGAWIVKAGGEARALMRHWSQWWDEARYHYVDDSPSRTPNALDFREHRHDQSVLSLLVKSRYGAASFVSETECWVPGAPIVAARLR